MSRPPIALILVLLAAAPARAAVDSLRLATLHAEPEPPSAPMGPDEPSDELPALGRPVGVGTHAEDEAIAERLRRIFESTRWFEELQVRVDQGVVFLSGRADAETHRDWAGRLASSTEDVVAVVNRIELPEPAAWDLSPAVATLRGIARGAIRTGPLVLLGALLLVLAWLLTRWTRRSAAPLLRRRLRSPLLGDVAAHAVSVPVFLVGLYVVLRVAGWTSLATTILGGTGLLGLIIGFAFRDIAENFLASVLISLQRPFAKQDLVEVAGFKGYVQSVNTRSTLLMTLEGNHVQIPNATIYKATITNFTANPNERLDFAVGIGYADSISGAQAVALRVLKEHPAVLGEPEPLVLVEALGPATVNLRVSFWIDISLHSGAKVRSAIIRLVKRAFDQADISMPDEAREIVFPGGVPVRMLDAASVPPAPRTAATGSRSEEARPAVQAEGALASTAPEIRQQADRARTPEEGRDLLEQA